MKIKACIATSGLLLLSLHALTAQVTYTIYATREGLVGQKTANGHTIVLRDRFVALPSKTALNALGGTTYTVNLYYSKTGRTVRNVPVWDVGPWNTKDNYWQSPRAEFTDLPLGLPEAQAAYQNGYNNGRDEFGRLVANPAGIDLADGTFWDDLGMSGNDWVQVTFNWVTPPSAGKILDNSNSGFSASANWATGSSAADKYGANYRWRATQATSDAATWTVSNLAAGTYAVYAWWSAGSNRSAAAPYIVYHATGSTTVKKNQQANGGKWNLLGTFKLDGGSEKVALSCWTTSGYVVVADAIKWVKQ